MRAPMNTMTAVPLAGRLPGAVNWNGVASCEGGLCAVAAVNPVVFFNASRVLQHPL
jgi:hypothetical protein